MQQFAQYTNAGLDALKHHYKISEVLDRKQEILDAIYQSYDLKPDSVLFVGFSPAILSCDLENMSVTGITDQALDYLNDRGIKFQHVVDFSKITEKFSAVITLDEFFTFADSDEYQREQIQFLSNITSDVLVTTIRDYKNQEYKDREFSQPALIRNAGENLAFLETHDWDLKDRQRWTTSLYGINISTDEVQSYGKFDRRTMYFKQLAKFGTDAGAREFLVHKNLMYKSLIRKNYEHVVSLRF
jgi:arginine deiminase